MNPIDALGLTVLFLLCVVVGFFAYRWEPRYHWVNLNEVEG